MSQAEQPENGAVSNGGVYSTDRPRCEITCDLRSDTVTKPCAGMRKAIAESLVGDDVMEEDPTVHKLERYVADLCGKEAALFVASGTMSNQLAMRTHLQAMESVLMDSRAHVFVYECGGVAAHSQAQVKPVYPRPNEVHLTADTLEAAIVDENVHHATTTLISLENTLGGAVMPLKTMQEIRAMATRRGLRVHLDGARLWNACVQSGVEMRQYASCVDSLSLCLSKTLGAPIGSVLVGTHPFIAKARKFRKLFGGGWRQAGVLAAAGLFAIEHNWGPTMQAVHDNAKLLGDGLRKLGFTINKDYGGVVQTNIVWVDNEEPYARTGVTMPQIAKEAEKHGIVMWASGKENSGGSARLVCHHQAPREGIMKLLSVVQGMMDGAATR